MTSVEIRDLLHMHFGIDVTTLSVGSNLGYLRAAGVVERRSCSKWEKPYYARGHWNTATENWWWHKEAVDSRTVQKFLVEIRRGVEQKLRDYQLGRGRPVTKPLPPRTDDMRQMLVDLEGRI
jgi:hypothetical protein